MNTEKYEQLMKGPPTESGPGGRAWHIPEELGEDTPASLAGWVVHCPHAHPMWSWYMVATVHLRDVPGAPPAKKNYPEAEYEFLILAFDPGEAGKTAPAPMPPFRYLEPIDVLVQYHGVTDQDARRINALAVRLIIEGKLSPDQDYRNAWVGTIEATVRCMKAGNHSTL